MMAFCFIVLILLCFYNKLSEINNRNNVFASISDFFDLAELLPKINIFELILRKTYEVLKNSIERILAFPKLVNEFRT